MQINLQRQKALSAVAWGQGQDGEEARQGRGKRRAGWGWDWVEGGGEEGNMKPRQVPAGKQNESKQKHCSLMNQRETLGGQVTRSMLATSQRKNRKA